MTITLATLADATPQQVFDQVRDHMLTQNQKIQAGAGICLYRNPQGLQCAAGCLISDDEYSWELEKNGWPALVGAGYVPPNPHDLLINELQDTHDEYDPSDWRRLLNDVAARFNLTP